MRPDDPRLLAILAFAEPEEHGALIVERAAAIATGQRPDPESAALLGASLNVVGAFDLSASFLAAAVAGLRDQGRLGGLPLVLTHQAWTAINTMDWAVAVPAAEESVRLAEDVGQPLWGVGAQTAVAMLAGLRGDYEKADAESRAAESVALPTRASSMLAGIRLTRGVAALAAGRYEHRLRGAAAGCSTGATPAITTSKAFGASAISLKQHCTVVISNRDEQCWPSWKRWRSRCAARG